MNNCSDIVDMMDTNGVQDDDLLLSDGSETEENDDDLSIASEEGYEEKVDEDKSVVSHILMQSNSNEEAALGITPNYNGVQGLEVGENNSNGEFNFASTLCLRKNLTETFDKHVNGVESPRKDAICKNNIPSSSVKEKIKAFEQKTLQDESSNGPKCRVRFERNLNHQSLYQNDCRPPTAPTLVKTGVLSLKNSKNKDTSCSGKELVSVYLRVRPPVISSSQTDLHYGHEDDASSNTVEFVRSTGITQKSNEDNFDEIKCTKIRTYPPLNSNAYKVIRGQHDSSTLKQTKNGGKNCSTETSEELASKGVKEYEFQEVFGPSTSQKEVYNEVAEPLVNSLFKSSNGKVCGKSALLFTYGITNAGKSYTIVGNDDFDIEKGSNKEHNQVKKRDSIHPNHGIIPRAMAHILKNLETNHQEISLHMSYFEIYNENIYDLLPSKEMDIKQTKLKSTKYTHIPKKPLGFERKKSLKIREGHNGRTYVRGLRKHPIKSVTQGLDLLREAKANKHTSSNNINNDSSRSHCICQFELIPCSPENEDVKDNKSYSDEISGYNTDDDGYTSNSSASSTNSISRKKIVTMWIVDLAGSERSKRTGSLHNGTRQKEAVLINSSLMKLMRCIQAIRNNQNNPSRASSVIPFRESKLTHLFMDHLLGSSVSGTNMIVNINPSAADYDETQHVLSYVSVAKGVRISEVDYFRNKRAIQITRECETGEDDLKNKMDTSENNNKKATSPPRKIARLVERLSPRAALAKRREQKLHVAQKRKADLLNMRSGKLTTTGLNKFSKISEKYNQKGKKKVDAKKNNNLHETKSNNSLQNEIKKLNTELADAKLQITALKEKLTQCESDIRLEVANETRAQFDFMKEQHNDIVRRLRQQNSSAPTPLKSAQKAKMDKASEVLEELMDKVDECEEEMERMRTMHEEDIANIKNNHAQEIERILNKNNEASKCYEQFASDKARLEAEVSLLRKEANILRKERDDIAVKYEQVANDSDISSEDCDSVDGDGENNDNSEERECKKSKSTTPRIRKLGRTRVSEVAVGDLSPATLEVISSSKKKRGKYNLRSSTRAPFSPLPNGSTRDLHGNQ